MIPDEDWLELAYNLSTFRETAAWSLNWCPSTTGVSVETERFVPDHDLVIHLVHWLSDRPKGEAFMTTAHEALVFLYEECGVDVPEQSDGSPSPEET